MVDYVHESAYTWIARTGNVGTDQKLFFHVGLKQNDVFQSMGSIRTVPYLKDDSSNKVERMATEKSQAASRLVYAAQHPPVAALVYVALKINGVSLASRHMSVGCSAASPYSRWAASAMIGHGCSQLADLLQSKH